jgi:hypothetical protein
MELTPCRVRYMVVRERGGFDDIFFLVKLWLRRFSDDDVLWREDKYCDSALYVR